MLIVWLISDLVNYKDSYDDVLLYNDACSLLALFLSSVYHVMALICLSLAREFINLLVVQCDGCLEKVFISCRDVAYSVSGDRCLALLFFCERRRQGEKVANVLNGLPQVALKSVMLS